MVKLIFLCRRRPDITHERYAALLLCGHVPIALKHHPSMRHYLVNIVEHTPDGWDVLDSVGELWFDSLEDFRVRLYDSPAGKAIVERDVAGFMGGANAYATTEHVHKRSAVAAVCSAGSAAISFVCPVMRRGGMSHAEFVEYWLMRHVPLVLAHRPGMVKYVANVVDQRLGNAGPALDGIAELHFASTEALTTEMSDSADGARIIREDSARFIGRTAAYRVAEYPQR